MSATIKGTAMQSTSVQSVSEGAPVFLRIMRDGSLVSANWKMAGILQGLGYMVNVGAFSTPITGGGNGTILDQDQPEFVISVPTGTSIIPLRAEVVCAVPILTADSEESEILLAVDQDAANTSGGGGGTSETIYNMNTLKGSGSACTVVSAITADITTAPTLDLELMHKLLLGDFGDATGISHPELYGLYQPEAGPILNGPCMLIGYWGGTVAVTGFAVVQWLEFRTSFVAI